MSEPEVHPIRDGTSANKEYTLECNLGASFFFGKTHLGLGQAGPG